MSFCLTNRLKPLIHLANKHKKMLSYKMQCRNELVNFQFRNFLLEFNFSEKLKKYLGLKEQYFCCCSINVCLAKIGNCELPEFSGLFFFRNYSLVLNAFFAFHQ